MVDTWNPFSRRLVLSGIAATFAFAAGGMTGSQTAEAA
jgi:hypothetical protein